MQDLFPSVALAQGLETRARRTNLVSERIRTPTGAQDVITRSSRSIFPRAKVETAVLWLSVVGLGGAWPLLASWQKDALSFGCPFYELTTLECPLCGATRSGFALLHGNFVDAADWNLLVPVTSGVFALCVLALAVRPKAILKRFSLLQRYAADHPSLTLVCTISALLAWTALRNLVPWLSAGTVIPS